MHAAEHKSQIAAILKQHGEHPDLDELDELAFVRDTAALRLAPSQLDY